MKPRMLPLDVLMIEMEGEHDSVCYELMKAENDLSKLDYGQFENEIAKLKEMLSQHTIDEQRSLLGFLIEKLGRYGSNSEIEIMRNQTQIMNIINKITKYTKDSKGIDISDLEELRSILCNQFKAEQLLYREVLALKNSDRSFQHTLDLNRYEYEGGK